MTLVITFNIVLRCRALVALGRQADATEECRAVLGIDHQNEEAAKIIGK